MRDTLCRVYGPDVTRYYRLAAKVLYRLPYPTYFDADDLVQEVLIGKWQNPDYDPKLIMWNSLYATHRRHRVKFIDLQDWLEPPEMPSTDRMLDLVMLLNKETTGYQRRIVLLLLQGFQAKEIGSALGKSRQSIQDALGLFLKKCRSQEDKCKASRARRQLQAKVRAMKLAGWLQRDIARQLGLSKTKVHLLCREVQQ